MAAERPVVTALNLFPLKSGKAVEMQELRVDRYGVVDDRRFMIVDGTTNRFLHQRRIPKMALIRAVYVTVNDKQALRLSAPGVPDLTVEPRLDGEVREVGVWQQTAPAVDQGDEAAAWFSKFLGPAAEYARLVRVLEGDPKSRPIEDLPEDVREALSQMHVAFQDSAPLTIVSQESLADLNSHLKERTGEEVPMNRFRMNIEVKGCSKAFDEDEWFLVEIGGVSFMVYEVTEVCVCARMCSNACIAHKYIPHYHTGHFSLSYLCVHACSAAR